MAVSLFSQRLIYAMLVLVADVVIVSKRGAWISDGAFGVLEGTPLALGAVTRDMLAPSFVSECFGLLFKFVCIGGGYLDEVSKAFNVFEVAVVVLVILRISFMFPLLASFQLFSHLIFSLRISACLVSPGGGLACLAVRIRTVAHAANVRHFSEASLAPACSEAVSWSWNFCTKLAPSERP